MTFSEEIEDEIRTIKREGSVRTFENYQIKSRFDDVTKITNELIGDFREVEENFKMFTLKLHILILLMQQEQ